MGFDVHGKVCLVTGSAQGLGKEFAKRLLSNGGKVCVSDVDEELGRATCRELEKAYPSTSLTFCRLDVTDRQQWEGAFKHCLEVFEDKVSVLVNNAGVGFDVDLEPVLRVNLVGAAVGCDVFVREVGASKGGRGGRIVNIASLAGLVNGFSRSTRLAGYTVSKWGLVSFTREVAAGGKTEVLRGGENAEENDGVKAYALCPTFVDTQLLGEDRERIMERAATLRVEDVGEALMRALEEDVNGSVVLLNPGLPAIRMAEMNGAFVLPVLGPMVKVAYDFGLVGKTVDVMNFFRLFLLLLVLLGFAVGSLFSHFFW